MEDKNLLIANLLFPDITQTQEDMEKRFPERALAEGAKVTRIAPSPTGFVHFGNLFPAFVSERLARQSGGVFLLLQPGHLTLRVEDLLIAALHLLILLGTAALQLQLLRRQRCQLLLQPAALGPQLFRLLPVDIHLPASFLIGPTEPLQQRLPPGPVGMHLGLQTLQLLTAVE